MWWQEDYLIILCEDKSSSIFSYARQYFQEVADSNDMRKEDKHPLRHWLEGVFPDIYFSDLFLCKGCRAVGVGATREHRDRAGYLGLALQMSQPEGPGWPDQWLRLHKASRQAPWLRNSLPLKHFYHLDAQSFWQNFENWRQHRTGCSIPLLLPEVDRANPIQPAVLDDIKRACRPALHWKLEQQKEECLGGLASSL